MSVQVSTLTLLRNGWGQAGASLRHGKGWKSTLAAFTAILVLLQGLLLFAFAARGFNALLLERAGLHLEVLPTAKDQDIQELYAVLQALPSVRQADFIPKEKAFEQEKLADPELAAFFEQYELGNPFPDSFVVTLRSADDYPAFLETVQQERYRAILDPSFLASASTQEKDLHDVLKMTGAFQMLAFGFAALAIIVFYAMMAEYVARALRERRDEFMLQAALGASHVSLSSVLASELTLVLLWGCLLSVLIVAVIIAILVAVVSSSGAGDVFLQFQAAIRPFLLTALPVVLVLEIVLLPFCAWGIASRGLRKEYVRPS